MSIDCYIGRLFWYYGMSIESKFMKWHINKIVVNCLSIKLPTVLTAKDIQCYCHTHHSIASTDNIVLCCHIIWWCHCHFFIITGSVVWMGKYMKACLNSKGDMFTMGASQGGQTFSHMKWFLIFGRRNRNVLLQDPLHQLTKTSCCQTFHFPIIIPKPTESHCF